MCNISRKDHDQFLLNTSVLCLLNKLYILSSCSTESFKFSDRKWCAFEGRGFFQLDKVSYFFGWLQLSSLILKNLLLMELHEFSLWTLTTKFLCWIVSLFVHYQMQQCYFKYYLCEENHIKTLWIFNQSKTWNFSKNIRIFCIKSKYSPNNLNV